MNSMIFRQRWLYDSKIWLIKNIKLTKRKISDLTISIEIIESEKSNCKNCLNKNRDCDLTISMKKWSFRKI
jgi:hypothetical protein